MFKTRSTLLCCLKVLAVAASIFLVGACSTAPMRGYTGPERPASETAIIRGATSSINTESCDGVKVTSIAVSVLPGDHTIEMSLGNPYDTAFLKFNAIAGYTYVVDTETIPYTGRQAPFVKDKSTEGHVSINTTVQEKLALVENLLKSRPKDLELLVQKGQHHCWFKKIS